MNQLALPQKIEDFVAEYAAKVAAIPKVVADHDAYIDNLPASDRKALERAMQDPPEFTADNIVATFGDYVTNPRQGILRGLAEQFTRLDPAYKSHIKVKIGAKALPRRIVPRRGGYYSTYVDHLLDLVAVLPASSQDEPEKFARHQKWRDLPVGSFRSSGTNVCSGLLEARP